MCFLESLLRIHVKSAAVFLKFVVSLSNPIYDKTKRREKGKAKRKRPSFSISNVFGLNQISKVVHFSFFFTFGMLHLVLLSSLMIRLWFFNLILPFFSFDLDKSQIEF